MAQFVFSAFADEAGNSIEAQITALKRNDIRYIEPRSVDGSGIIFKTEDELRAIKGKLDEAGIRVNSLGSPIGKFPIESKLEEHLPDFEKAITAAKILNTGYMRVFSFYVAPNELDKYRDEVIRRMKVMTEIAGENGITLCHENEKKIYGELPERVKDLLDNVDGLGAIFDPANYRCVNADCTLGMDVSLPKLKYLHIKDAIYEGEVIVPAGEGEGKIAEAIDRADKAYDSLLYLTVEPHLKLFDAYRSIDSSALRGKYSFNTADEAFDTAVHALEKLMFNNGFRKGENGIWKR